MNKNVLSSALNTHSEAELEAEMHRYFLANWAR